MTEQQLQKAKSKKLKKLSPQILEQDIAKIRRESDFIVLTPRIFKIYQRHGKTKCASCNLELRIFDTVYNSSTRKPYHILCALAKKLITL
ncbi:MAG: hypothetical protein QW177_04100 [Candidatus Nitrosotenuis sp.]|nr:hypothetical protein [Candidatus Nitrosotenuis sp.]